MPICVVSVGWYSVLALVGFTAWAMRIYASWQRLLLRMAGGLFVLFGFRLFLQSTQSNRARSRGFRQPGREPVHRVAQRPG